MFRTPKVLLLMSDEAEVQALEAMLGQHALMVQAHSISEMNSHLQKDGIDVLFCGWSYYLTHWPVVLKGVRRHHPNLPVIVLSRHAGEREWIEVLESGAFDLLAWPSPRPNVLAVVEQAAASHEARNLDGLLGGLAENRLAV